MQRNIDGTLDNNINNQTRMPSQNTSSVCRWIISLVFFFLGTSGIASEKHFEGYTQHAAFYAFHFKRLQNCKHNVHCAVYRHTTHSQLNKFHFHQMFAPIVENGCFSWKWAAYRIWCNRSICFQCEKLISFYLSKLLMTLCTNQWIKTLSNWKKFKKFNWKFINSYREVKFVQRLI